MSSTTFHAPEGPSSRRRFGMSPPGMPIPDRLNLLLVGLVVSGALALLWLASHVESWWAVLAVGVVYSYLLLTNYALLHEATHDNLNSDPRLNYFLGFI